MRYILLSLSFLLFFSFVPAMAQGVSTSEAPVSTENLALAEKMHEIWPIRVRIESAIDSIAENFPAAKRAQVKATLRKNIQYDQVEEESIKAMATTFTKDELQSMIDFYGSEVGRSISAKTSDYELALRPVMTKMMDKAVLDLKTGTKP